MPYVFALPAEEWEQRDTILRIRHSRFLTATVPSAAPPASSQSQVALVFVPDTDGDADRYHLHAMGVVSRARGEKVATIGRRVKAEALREVTAPFTSTDIDLDEATHDELTRALRMGAAPLSPKAGDDVLAALRRADPSLARLLEWLGGLLDPDRIEGDSFVEQLWWMERDALRVAMRIADLPSTPINAWRRPTDGAPYLSGLITDPTEQSMIEHDARSLIPEGWYRDSNRLERHDITVVTDGDRRLEITNVNATPVEGRLGADLIYYHENSRSFTLVQYKKLGPERDILVNQQLRRQLDRLEYISTLSCAPRGPEDWRVGSDPCLLKLVEWTPDGAGRSQGAGRGMYLPVSYVRLLLEHPCTEGIRGGRRLGYGVVPRYLDNSRFIDLVKEGLIGTVGTTVEQLRALVTQRVSQGHGVVMAAERGGETANARQARNRSRGPTRIRPTSGQQRLW
ncbi:hypothetical protein J4H86_18980 [Spiractinospora alimapuensis]|uniref:hypothetical protein n=1 Tax=Spiractinospora alimapuensis TaxID=2820884 RepID=UPI001F47370A|nr:hypothetical protein [Spiractinospora alimapuensis]QVQ50926.1 hypothetical protein J4H86_18980 [Spiractinospora alimapuensis]